jgi:hypothetical protein
MTKSMKDTATFQWAANPISIAKQCIYIHYIYILIHMYIYTHNIYMLKWAATAIYNVKQCIYIHNIYILIHMYIHT